MTIFILLGIGLLFLIITSILIAIDNRRRKLRKKKLKFVWRVVGVLCTIISLTSLIQFTKYVVSFEGVEYGDRKILLRTTMELTDITIPSNNATLDLSLADVINSKKEEQEKQKKECQEIVYVDALLNKKRIPVEDIHEIKYSEDLTSKQVQVVEYLVIMKDGNFTMPGVYYYIIFGEELNPENKTEENTKTETTKKKKVKESQKTNSKKTNSKKTNH